VSYPQIDDIRSTAVDAWNARAEKNLDDADDKDCDGDVSIGYDVGFANDKVISLSWTDGVYCHGTPHGYWSIRNDNYVLSPSPRVLQTSDIFDAAKPWTKEIGELLLQALHAEGWGELGEREEQAEDEMRGVAASPKRWFLTTSGIEYRFSAYEGGCYACTPQPATIKWSDLKPMLAPTAVVP
jgi:hypothetical protein